MLDKHNHKHLILELLKAMQIGGAYLCELCKKNPAEEAVLKTILPPEAFIKVADEMFPDLMVAPSVKQYFPVVFEKYSDGDGSTGFIAARFGDKVYGCEYRYCSRDDNQRDDEIIELEIEKSETYIRDIKCISSIAFNASTGETVSCETSYISNK